MARLKLKKIIQAQNLPNVFSWKDENVESVISEFFGNDNSFTLEIGCGHGDYTIELARMYPERNFIGVDYKRARIYTAATKANELKLKNAAFLISGAEKLADIFSEEKVNEIFIPFPDPHYPRKSFKRLVSQNFLNIYKSIVTADAKIHLKTDNEELFKYALIVLEKENCTIRYVTSNLYSEQDLDYQHTIKTKYEKQYLEEGKEIKYICFGWG